MLTAGVLHFRDSAQRFCDLRASYDLLGGWRICSKDALVNYGDCVAVVLRMLCVVGRFGFAHVEGSVVLHDR